MVAPADIHPYQICLSAINRATPTESLIGFFLV